MNRLSFKPVRSINIYGHQLTMCTFYSGKVIQAHYCFKLPNAVVEEMKITYFMRTKHIYYSHFHSNNLFLNRLVVET